MGRRVLPALLLSAALVADRAGDHALALDSLLLAVPLIAVCALAAFGDYLDTPGSGLRGLQSFLWGLAVVLVVASCAVRSGSVHGAPPLATTTLVACLLVLAVKAAVAGTPHLLRLADLRPAKP